MDHAQGIAAARKLSTRSEADQWELARLTYEHTTGQNALTVTKWAEGVGVSQPHATNLRKTWILFEVHKGTNTRQGRSFNECYTIAMRTRRGEHPRDVRGPRGEGGRNGAGRKRDPMDVLREVVRDRKRRRELLEIPEVRDVVEREVRDRVQRELRRERERTERGPRTRNVVAPTELEAIRHRMHVILDALLDRTLTKAERKALLVELDELDTAASWMRSYVTHGDTSFEDALDALLEAAPPTEPVAEEPHRKQRPVRRRVPPPASAVEPVVTQEPPAERGERDGSRRTRERRGPRRRAS